MLRNSPIRFLPEERNDLLLPTGQGQRREIHNDQGRQIRRLGIFCNLTKDMVMCLMSFLDTFLCFGLMAGGWRGRFQDVSLPVASCQLAGQMEQQARE
eukprot:scaffold26602_cov154-Skeletonema_menzelii.AAC.3